MRAASSGKATHNCTPFNRPLCPAGVSSLWLMPFPEVITLTPPGRTIASQPRLSLCSTSPSSSQETVCNPMCGCGGTFIGFPWVKDSGPKRSRKHQGPTSRRSRIGSAR